MSQTRICFSLGFWGFGDLLWAGKQNIKIEIRNSHTQQLHFFQFLQFLLAFKHSRSSYLAFSVGPAMRLRKNSSLFFCMISSWVKPWLPFSTIFCPEDDDLPWSALTGSAAGAGKVNGVAGERGDYYQTSHLQSATLEQVRLPSFLVFLFFLLLCSLPLSPPFVSIIDFTVFWDFSDSLKVRMGAGLRALLLFSASLVVSIWYISTGKTKKKDLLNEACLHGCITHIRCDLLTQCVTTSCSLRNSLRV